MTSTKIKSMVIILTASMVLSGCSVSVGSKKQAAVVTAAGVWATANKGDTWAQKNLVPSTGAPKNIAGLDVNDLVMDPSDHKTLYMASKDNGLFYTYDSGDSWLPVLALGQINISSVAVDPAAKCTIYAATGNKVVKSDDCSRTWSQVYTDNDPAIIVTTVAVDQHDNNNVFIGLSRGEILKSTDKGGNWKKMARFDDRVEKIVISPNDSRIILAGTTYKGIYRSRDNGNTWSDLKKNFDALPAFYSNFRDMVMPKASAGEVLLANRYGLVKSTDNGDTWSEISLLTPENAAIINSLSVSQKSADEIYYVTNTTFYRSIDAGKTWATKSIPSARAGSRIVIDPEDTAVIYLGLKTVAAKR